MRSQKFQHLNRKYKLKILSQLVLRYNPFWTFIHKYFFFAAYHYQPQKHLSFGLIGTDNVLASTSSGPEK